MRGFLLFLVLLVSWALPARSTALVAPVHTMARGTYIFPDGIQIPSTSNSSFEAPWYAVRSSNGIEGRFRARSTGAFIESPDPNLPDAASILHFVGLYDPAVKNGVCDDTSAASKGADCGADSDCGGTAGACKRDGARCDAASTNKGVLCQVSADCTGGGACNTGTAVKNFPPQGRPVLETGGTRTFIGARRDLLVDGRPSVAAGALGACVKRGAACLTDATCAGTNYCNGGANKDSVCTVDSNCPSGKCEPEYCVNLQCTKVFPFAGTCLKDADCVTPVGQTCWRGYRSFDWIIRGYDCAVDTGSLTSPTGDGRIDVAASDGEANCVDTTTSGAGTPTSLEHNWRLRVEIDNPGTPSKSAGVARCHNTGALCTTQAACPGSYCQASDPFEANHVEFNNEAVGNVWKANRDGQMTFTGPQIYGDGIKRCTHNPVLQCLVDADCPPWQGGTLDVCRGDDIVYDASAYIDSAVQFSSNGFLKTLPGAIMRFADTLGDVYSFTDAASFADHKRDLRLQCNDGSCAIPSAESRHLKFRARNTSVTSEWDIFAASTAIPELWIQRPLGANPTFRLNYGSATGGVTAYFDGSIGDASGNGNSTYATANGWLRTTRKVSSSLPTCDVTTEGLLAHAGASTASRTCTCEKTDCPGGGACTPTYGWRVVGGNKLACDSAAFQFQATSGTTISVIGREVVELNYGSGATVTDLTGGVRGQRVTFICLTSNVTFSDGATIHLAGGGPTYNCLTDSVVSFVLDGSSVWREVSRSVN